MMTSDVNNIYEMEDLIPIVGKLAEEFTAKESSSVTYERARQFMEAVIYCMAHLETGGNLLVTAVRLPAKEAYQLGRDAVIEKNIITMDYPILGLDMTLEGIDMIRQYIDAIWEEQLYLLKLPRNYVISSLRTFHPCYENEYFNIKEIVEFF